MHALGPKLFQKVERNAARKVSERSEEKGRVAHRRIARRRLMHAGRVPQSHQ
jgi:hypothetical protein